MSKKDTLYPQSIFKEEVPGVSVPWRWAGRNQSGNRRSIPPNYFWTAENVRIEDDDVIGRKGLTKVNSGDNSSTREVMFIHRPNIRGDGPLNSGSFRGLIMAAEGQGVLVYSKKFNKNTPKILAVTGVSNPEAGSTYVNWDGRIVNSSGRYASFPILTDGTIELKFSEPFLDPLPKLNQGGPSGGQEQANQMVVFPGDDTIGDDDDAVNALWYVSADNEVRFYTKEGKNEVDTSSLGTIFGLGELNGQLITLNHPATLGSNHFHYRDYDGTWTAVAIPSITDPGGDTITDIYLQGMSRYKNKLLLHFVAETSATGGGATTTGRGIILVWDGSSLTEGVTVVDNNGPLGSDLNFRHGVEFSDGNYYWVWHARFVVAVSDGESWLGKYDGTTFTEEFFNLDTVTNFPTNQLGPIGVSGNSLVVTARDSVGSGNAVRTFISTNASSWEELDSTTEAHVSEDSISSHI